MGRARRVIVRAIGRDGTFLDIGCANGHLMETLQAWCREDGRETEPYGLDASRKLAGLARRRLPRWADRFFVGDAMAWDPPMRFDFVRTELDYVEEGDRPRYIGRLLEGFVKPGGRLVVCSYGTMSTNREPCEPVGDLLRWWGFGVAGEADAADSGGVLFTRIAWVDVP